MDPICFRKMVKKCDSMVQFNNTFYIRNALLSFCWTSPSSILLLSTKHFKYFCISHRSRSGTQVVIHAAFYSRQIPSEKDTSVCHTNQKPRRGGLCVIYDKLKLCASKVETFLVCTLHMNTNCLQKLKNGNEINSIRKIN